MSFPIQDQTQSQWCWAAVAASVDAFYSASAARSQCNIAGRVLRRKCCDDDLPACNQAANLGRALKVIGRYKERKPMAIPFNEVKDEIDSERPVGVRIQWQGGRGHYLLITGYESASTTDPLVWVSDPAWPDVLIRYDILLTSYQNPERPGSGSGHWSHTYLLHA